MIFLDERTGNQIHLAVIYSFPVGVFVFALLGKFVQEFTMSIVAEVLNTKTEAEMLSLPKKMSEISRCVAMLRTKVKEFMEAKYLRLLKGTAEDKSNLVERAAEMSENIKDLQARLEQLTLTETANVADEIRTMKESLIEARIMCDITSKLLAIDKEFEQAFMDQESKKFHNAACHLKKVEEILTRDRADLEFLHIYDALNDKNARIFSDFSGDALKLWKSEVSWIICPLDSAVKTTSLKVHLSKEFLENLIKTLNVFEVSEPQVYYFSQTFYAEVLVPCIESRVTVTIKPSPERNVQLSVSCLPGERPHLAEVLESLTQVFDFLHRHMALAIDEDRSFIRELGHHLADKFLSHLVRESLSDAIPSRRQDLPEYEGLVQRVIEFNNLLKTLKFVDEANDVLEKFCGSVEEQFLNKTIERYLSRAREIATLNLQDMTPVNPNATDPNWDLQTIDGTRKDVGPQFAELPCDFGQFPSCHVSKSVYDLMNLVKNILDECVSGSHSVPNTPLKLFCTARDCINLYVELVPVIHIKLLESLPQQSALFHNNCFYIAHELVTLNEPYRTRYSDQVMRVMGTVVDLVPYVRSQGLKALEFQVSKQNDMIMDIVARSGLSSLMEEDVPPMLEKSLRQCVHMLSFLETMWLTVLPTHVYNKILGQLCNSFLDEVISRVITTKDIKEATATHLVRVFGYVQETLPSLFEEPKEVHRHIKKWSKFIELIQVLNGSLVDIGDRWADGKGPLAMEFTAGQVRQLIKALFQVSDRRAAVLSRIK